MIYQGVLTKMQTEFTSPVQYYLIFEDSFLNINQLLNKYFEINLLGYQCLNCKKDKKIYRQGFCYNCFYSSPSVGNWIMRPELSTAHLGIEDRDLAYEKKVQLQAHVVYLALSSDLKVGVTRKSQMTARWIDQGAIQATVLIEVPNRYLAGITEVTLKKQYTDKTNWRKMLQNEIPAIDLLIEKEKAKELLPFEVRDYLHSQNDDLYKINYPIMEFPKKAKSLNLEKTQNFKGRLVGIKGQYLLFEDQTVFNIRSFEGYRVEIKM